MIFVDTGAWCTVFVPVDPDHARATQWLAANRQPLVTTDYVVDETLTLLRSRGEKVAAIQAGDEFFGGELASVHYLTEDDIRAAWDVFRRFRDKDWSFTDCTSKVVMEQLGISRAFAFDQHFRQFGTVNIVPWRLRGNEITTMDEIKARFAPDWVLIGEPRTDEFYRVQAGKVLFHFAFEFLGQRPRDMEFIL
jgi:predicted nucleic acid-binding protein